MWQGGRGGGTGRHESQHGDQVFDEDGAMIGGAAGTARFSNCAPTVPGDAADGQFMITTDCTIQGRLTGGATVVPALPAIRSPGLAIQGQPTTLSLRGPANTAVLLFFDVNHGHLPVPGFDVPFLLTGRVNPDRVLTIGASGVAPYTFTLPVDPFWKNKFLFYQGVAVQPAPGPITLTNLGDLRMR